MHYLWTNYGDSYDHLAAVTRFGVGFRLSLHWYCGLLIWHRILFETSSSTFAEGDLAYFFHRINNHFRITWDFCCFPGVCVVNLRKLEVILNYISYYKLYKSYLKFPRLYFSPGKSLKSPLLFISTLKHRFSAMILSVNGELSPWGPHGLHHGVRFPTALCRGLRWGRAEWRAFARVGTESLGCGPAEDFKWILSNCVYHTYHVQIFDVFWWSNSTTCFFKRLSLMRWSPFCWVPPWKTPPHCHPCALA